MEYNPQGFSMGDWYVWYLSLEMGPDLFSQHYTEPTGPDCQDIPDYAIVTKDGKVAGLVADRPGKLWKHMTGHLKKLQSPISKSYFDTIDYVKVPASWSSIMSQHQLQHALASVSEKWVNRDWSDSDHREFPSELNQPFDTSLLNPPERIPDAVLAFDVRNGRPEKGHAANLLSRDMEAGLIWQVEDVEHTSILCSHEGPA